MSKETSFTGKPISVSMIVTTYNREDALEMTLLSIAGQDILPMEVIVADDGSRESTKNLLDTLRKNYPVPLIHCWHEDLGFRLAAIRNKAIAMAKGNYIIMVDGDMILHKRFIDSHVNNAQPHRFIQGSRVLLGPKKSEEAMLRKQLRISFFSKDIGNRLNCLYSPWLSTIFSYYESRFDRVRGANLSFWRKDVEMVNGFNEDFVGWGREDSEFAVRMENNGIRRWHIKFAGFGYHLYHKESSREKLEINDALLMRSMVDKIKQCRNGIVKLT